MSVRALNPALAEKARVELNEDPNRLQSDLQDIKEWIATQPHLRARTDDQWILTFLRGCKFNLDKTKVKLEAYYTFRTTVPELYRVKHTDPLFDEILSLHSYTILPKAASPDAPRIIIFRPRLYDPNKFHILDIFSVVNTLWKIIFMEDDHATVAGAHIIIIVDGLKIGHFMQMTPVRMKKMVTMTQEASPLRLKGIHYLNTPKGFETIFNAVKRLLSEKNQNRMYAHNRNYKALFEHIPQDLLPPEIFDGNGDTVEEITEYWRNKVKEYSSFLEEDMKYGTDESKRVNKSMMPDVFGALRRLWQ